jgi:hypothetical protein
MIRAFDERSAGLGEVRQEPTYGGSIPDPDERNCCLAGTH